MIINIDSAVTFMTGTYSGSLCVATPGHSTAASQNNCKILNRARSNGMRNIK
jgi:hypothetical protein